MADDGRHSLTAELVEFGAALRAANVQAAPSRMIEATASLGRIDVCDYTDFFCALRCSIPQSPAEVAAFDGLFDRFWRKRFRLDLPAEDDDSHPLGIVDVSGDATGDSTDDDELIPGEAARTEATGTSLRWPVRQALSLEDVAQATVASLAWRRGRRYRPNRRGPVIDPRRTMRRSFGHGGIPLVLARRERRPRKARVILICDVSRSMGPFVRLLLRYMAELGAAAARVEAFVFSMHLARITPALRRRSVPEAMRAISRLSGDWKSGTRIGLSLSEFTRRYAGLLDRDTAVLILSDGLDTDDPSMIAASLKEMRRLAGAVVWLNPLAASAAFEPRTRAMQAALPHLDLLASGHSVEALHEVALALRDFRNGRPRPRSMSGRPR